jgi:hypothetical protein
MGRRARHRPSARARVTVPAKATHRQTRQYNRRLVLRTLYDHSPVSRAEVARLTGLTRTTVSDVAIKVGKG